MKSPSWLKSLSGRITGRSVCSPLRRADRLRFEALEDRSVPATFTVRTTADWVEESLRWAILAANETPGADAIHFAIDTGVQTIAPTEPLPAITETVSVDGTTQPGYAGTPIVVLSGALAGDEASGLTIKAANCTVSGLVVNGFGGNGIHISGPDATGNRIIDNYIGTNPSGTAAVGNGGDGVLIDGGATGNTVGAPDLLVCDFDTGAVNRYDPTTGQYLGKLASKAGVIGAVSMEVGPDGYLYVASRDSYFHHAVLRYDLRTGAYVDTFIPEIGGVASITFTPDGHLLIAVDHGAVNRYDATTGEFKDVLIPATLVDRPRGLAVGPDGRLYVCSNGNDKILRFDLTTGAPIDEFAAGGELDGPNNLTFGPNGDLFVAAFPHTGLLRYDLGTKALLKTIPTGAPTDVQFGPDGRLYASGYRAAHPVGQYTSDGTFLRSFVGTAEESHLEGAEELLFATGPGGANVISGNGGSGVRITGAGTANNIVSGNYIGTDVTGKAAIGNQFGVRVDGGAAGNTVGGTTAGARNVITGNAGSGVIVTGADAVGNAIRQNLIVDNGGSPQAIDLVNGGNADQPAPTLTSARSSDGTTIVAGRLAPSTSYGLDFFSGPADGQARQYLGSAEVTTGEAGDFSVALQAAPSAGAYITATATRGGNTSELSAGITRVANLPPTADAGGPYTVAEGGSIPLAGSGSDPDQTTDTLTYQWDFDYAGTTFDVDATGIAPTFSAVGLDGPTTRTVALRVTDNSGAISMATGQLHITNVAPTPSIDGVPTTSPEGAFISLTASAADPSPADAAAGFTFTWHVVASNGQAIANGSGPSFTFIPTDNGTYTVTLTATDEDQGTGTTTSTIIVTDVAPNASINGPTDGLMGQTLAFDLTAYDPSPVDRAAGFTYRIDWDGNGSVDQTVFGQETLQVSHVFAQPGDYRVRVTVADGNGVTSSEYHQPVAVGWSRHVYGLDSTLQDVLGTATDLAGNVYVVGHTTGSLPGQTSAGSYDAYVRKYDSLGNTVWTSQFGSSSNDYAFGVVVDTSGAVYVAGFTLGSLPGQSSLGGFDAYIRKYNSFGGIVWTRQFGSSSNDFGIAVAVDTTGMAYVVGDTYGSMPGQVHVGAGANAYVRKYDSFGYDLWTHQLENSYAYGVAVEASGEVNVAGFGNLTGQPSAGGTDAFVRKYEPSGNTLWTRQFGSSSDELVKGMAVDSSGAVYVVGYSTGTLEGEANAGGSDAFVCKYDRLGNVAWTRQFGTNLPDIANGVAVDVSGSVYVVGATYGTLPGQAITNSIDPYVRKYDSLGTLVWTRQLGSSQVDGASGVAVDPAGAIYVVVGDNFGYLGQSRGSQYVFLRKYDSLGNAAWTRRFGGRVDDRIAATAVDATGAVYVAGHTSGILPGNSSAGHTDVFLSRSASDGTPFWTRQFGGSSVDYATGVAVDASGAVYVVGYTYGTLPGKASAGNADAFVRKYDSLGNEIWTRQFGTSSTDYVWGVAVDASGVYVSGHTVGTLAGQASAGKADAFVRKYDSLGNEVWTRQFGGGPDTIDVASGIAADGSGVYVTGYTLGTLPGQASAREAFVRRYTSNGDFEWTHQFGSSANDVGFGVAADASGVYVTGFTGGIEGPTSSGRVDAFVRRYNRNGGIEWTRQFGSSSIDAASSVAADATGVYVAGYTLGTLPGQTSAGGYDAFVRKYDTQGVVVWTRQFGGSSTDFAQAVAVAASGKVYVGGYTDGAMPGHTSTGDVDGFVAQFRVSANDPVVSVQSNDLTVTGTAGDDLIVLDPGPQSDQVRVTINGVLLGTVSVSGTIYVLGGAGNDSIVVNTLASTSVILDGQEGSDTYTANLTGLRGMLQIGDGGATGQDHQIINATADDDYVDKQAGEIKWWLRGDSAESNPVNPPPLLAAVSSTGVEKTTIHLGAGNDYVLDPGEETELFGESGDDTFVVTGTFGTGVRIEDRDGGNEVVVHLGALDGPVTVDVSGVLGTANLTVIGTDGVDQIAVSEAGLTTGTGEVIALIGFVQQLSIDFGTEGGRLTLDDLGSSPTRYNVVASDNGANVDVQVVGPPPDLTVNGNHAPTADAGGPYTVMEGGTVVLDGSASGDSEQAADTLIYEWDLDGDGLFDDATGNHPTFPAAGLDGFPGAAVTVRLRVTDAAGASSVSSATVVIANAVPVPTITSIGAVRVEGTAVTVACSATDPAGTLDTRSFAWAVYKDGSATAFATGGNTASFTFTPADDGSYRIVLTASDEDGGSASAEQTIAVDDVRPVAAIGGASTASEGMAITLTGTATDAGAADETAGFTYAWVITRSRDGGVTFQPYAAGGGATLTLYPDDEGLYRVTLTAADKDGATSEAAVRTLAVGNVAPAAVIVGPATGQQGIGLALQASGLFDPGTADAAAGFTYVWHVTRGGVPVDLSGIATTGPSLDFVPTEPGAYTVALTVTDKDGGATTVAHAVAVGATPGVTLLPGGRLVIVGTDGADKIMVNPGGGAPTIKVKINRSEQTFVGVTEVVIYANGGDDDVKVAGGVALDAWLFGGAGHDRLQGGGGHNVVVGGAGNDLVAGGAGRDLLIGGAGADRLVGNQQDDILVAGSTAFDADEAALGLILAEWTSARTFAQRVANLGGAAGGANGGVYLVGGDGPDATVSDDGAEDVLTGSQGNDWFLVNTSAGTVRDRVTDWSAYEAQYVEDIEFITTFVG
jgi:hypothetical protein